jgi:hypothetical protein
VTSALYGWISWLGYQPLSFLPQLLRNGISILSGVWRCWWSTSLWPSPRDSCGNWLKEGACSLCCSPLGSNLCNREKEEDKKTLDHIHLKWSLCYIEL